MTSSSLWPRFQKYFLGYDDLQFSIDISRMRFADGFFEKMQPLVRKAFASMRELEAGAIANPDEGRMVGHYWLRNPALAPTQEIRKEIENAIAQIKQFSIDVNACKISGSGGKFEGFLLIGIGGSALGPQFVAHALGDPRTDKLKPYFFDNTDPDGMDRVLATIGNNLGKTLCIVVSKSGGTKETRNGMLVAEAAYARAGLHFGHHAVAVTIEGSELSKYAKKNEWITEFPMWDWVGGRTSELSAVGLLPAALQGFDISNLISGACECDNITRTKDVKINPACQLALAWYVSGNGNGLKNMVILPYKDRLELFSKYLQQLIMESVGKEHDLNGNVVNQGITVLGNKGATDQHSYIQQLRDGLNDFFVTFIEVLHDGTDSNLAVEPNVTSGDFLNGFYLGTRQALAEKNRESITLTIKEVSPFTVGMLIALFERAVGIYASLVNINAYNQPGVEAGKKAAANIVQLQIKILEFLIKQSKQVLTVVEIAKGIGADEDIENVFKISEHMSANPDHKIRKIPDGTPFNSKYTPS